MQADSLTFLREPKYQSFLPRFPGIDYVAIADNMCVPTRACKLKNPRVLWVNTAWLSDHGLDIADADVRRRFEKELIESFGVMVPGEAVPQEEVYAETVDLATDRYGETGGGIHGGSGRMACAGILHAKGIGRTPLVSPFAGLSYTHGFLWLQEAIREIICNTWANDWLPYGTIPILALIDTGLEIQLEGYPTKERAAIIVRPNFVRPAHFERAFRFGTAGTADSHQYADAQRVKTIIEKFTIKPVAHPVDFIDLKTMFLRFAAQLGATRARRVWGGSFLTSNLSIDGALVDFGGFITLPNWGEIDEKIGREEFHYPEAVKSVCFYFDKYGQKQINTASAKDIVESMNQEVSRSFVEAVLNGIGTDSERSPGFAKDFGPPLLEYYRLQQLNRLRLKQPETNSRPWLSDFFDEKAILNRFISGRETTVARDLIRLIKTHSLDSAEFPVNVGQAKTFFHPWATTYFGTPLSDLTDLRWRLVEGKDTSMIGQYIDDQLHHIRTHAYVGIRH